MATSDQAIPIVSMSEVITYPQQCWVPGTTGYMGTMKNGVGVGAGE